MAITDLDIQRIKNGITLRSAYYSSLLLGMEIVADYRVKTAVVDGRRVRYNPDYVESLPFNQRIGLFAHEADHPARNHHTRIGDRELELYNVAADYSSNGELLKDGFELPPGFLIDPRFYGMPVERIYNILDREREKQQQSGGKKPGQQGNQPGEQPKSGQGQPQPGQGKPQPGKGQPQPGQGKPGPGDDLDFGGCGSVVPPTDDDGKPLSELELGKERAAWESHVHLAESVSKRIGNAPGSARTTVREMQHGNADWKDEMRAFMYRCVDQRYSWSSGDRRFAADDIWMPNRESKRIEDVVVGIDTSSSVSQRQLSIVKTEFNHMCNEVNPRRVHVIFWDTIVQRAVAYDDDERPIEFDFPGRGGTAVQAFFRYLYLNDINPVCSLIFSDLEIGDWGEEPEYPVLWGDLKARHTAPYGTQIDLSGV